MLFQNTDSPAVLKTAQEKGKRAFGWDSDMTAYGPKAHLASATINWAPYYIKATQDMLDGKWATGQSWWGVKEGAIDLVSIAEDVPAETKAKVEEVLDQARRTGLDVVGATVELAQAGIFLGRERRDGITLALALGRGVEPHPHQTMRLARRVRHGAVRGRGNELRQGRNLHAAAAGFETPTVVRAFKTCAALALHHPAERQLRAAVWTSIRPCMNGCHIVAPQHEAFAEQTHRDGCCRHILGQCDRMPELSFKNHRRT